ncbi:hypothetical protein PV328_001235 [Microctonus aethiopoides]|uniref:Exonuclease domain-containing protein n=1 Tax=Microctonus aethiopoides TaxID=144406 RepID=A0AA39FWZ9_9HYME|nr:hypothetical protein PV328_001235 [Microctonus aethiopoides]
MSDAKKQKRAIHSGVGSTGLNKILVCTNLAQISDRLYKKYEDIIGKAIESEARERIYTLRMLCLKTRNTLNLSDEALYEELVRLFQKYASNSHKFSIAASSQSNESFNNIVANKAHKNKCLNTSAAYDIRVAAAVCAKNDGEESILNIKIKLDIPIGSRIFEFVHRSDIKRQKRSIVSQSKAKKLRRIEMKKREVLRKNTEKREGITYEIEDETNVIYFDLETTGFAADGHILQIAAICDIQVFNIYKKVETHKISDALESFRQFLFKLSDSKKKCLLVAQNTRFDVPRLLHAINPGKFKLESLSKDFLKTLDNEQQSFHDAADDVLSLQNLVQTLNLKTNLFHSYKNCDLYLQELLKSDKTKRKGHSDLLQAYEKVKNSNLKKRKHTEISSSGSELAVIHKKLKQSTLTDVESGSKSVNLDILVDCTIYC